MRFSATLPDMWERTITIGSAGKTFSVTGWKVGWAYGPENLLSNAMTVHQNTVYTCCTPIQVSLQSTPRPLVPSSQAGTSPPSLGSSFQ